MASRRIRPNANGETGGCMRPLEPIKRKTNAIAPDSAVPAAFYSMDDLRRRCGSPTKPASRSKVYRMIAAQIVPAAIPNLNAWSAAAVDAALARLSSTDGGGKVMQPTASSALKESRKVAPQQRDGGTR